MPIFCIGYLRRAGFQARCNQCFQIAQTQIGIAVFCANHFALFSQTDFTLHTACGLRKNGFVAWSTATPHRAATTMKERHRDFGRTGDLSQGLLCLIQRPVGRQKTTIFVAVRVAQHDLLRPTTCIQPLIDHRQFKPCLHDLWCRL